MTGIRRADGEMGTGRFGIRASLVSWLEVGIASQVALVLMAFFLSARSQTVAVVATAMACALSVATLGIVAVSLVSKDDGEERVGFIESVIESVLAVILSVACLWMFVPRLGQFAETNPYSNNEKLQCVAVFVVGKDFVVPGSIQSDGFVVKAPEDEEVKPPTVMPRPGLTFVGWRYAGVGDPDIAAGTPIYLDANGTKNNSVILYAEFVDSEGTAYCSCGSMEEGIFDGATWQGMNTRRFLVAFAPVAVAALVGLVVCIRMHKHGDGHGDGGTGAETPAAEPAEGPGAEIAEEQVRVPVEESDEVPADVKAPTDTSVETAAGSASDGDE